MFGTHSPLIIAGTTYSITARGGTAVMSPRTKIAIGPYLVLGIDCPNVRTPPKMPYSSSDKKLSFSISSQWYHENYSEPGIVTHAYNP